MRGQAAHKSMNGSNGNGASIYVRPGQRQGASTFGDFTGNVKNFSMPEEDQLSSRKHLQSGNTVDDAVNNFA